MLERIVIEGYKSIRELDLELKPLNILIGANGAGKSNFISMFQLLNAMIEQRLQIYTGTIGAASLLHFGAKVTEQIRVRLWFSILETLAYKGDAEYEAIWLLTNENTLIFDREAVYTESANDPGFVDKGRYTGGHRESQIIDEADTPVQQALNDVINTLQSWKVYHFHDVSREAKIKQTGDIDDNEYLRPDGSNLAAFLYRLQETERPHYDRIVKTIRLVAPFFQDFDLRPSRLNPEKIRLEWREYGSDEYFNAHTLSDGTLRFMCLTTLLLQPELPSVILIDEPELGLHPYAINLLANMLQSAATQTQVIVSTQSVPLINQFTPEDIIVVDREGRQSVFKRLDAAALDHWLDEYAIGELWEKNIIGGRPQQPERPT